MARKIKARKRHVEGHGTRVRNRRGWQRPGTTARSDLGTTSPQFFKHLLCTDIASFSHLLELGARLHLLLTCLSHELAQRIRSLLVACGRRRGQLLRGLHGPAELQQQQPQAPLRSDLAARGADAQVVLCPVQVLLEAVSPDGQHGPEVSGGGRTARIRLVVGEALGLLNRGRCHPGSSSGAGVLRPGSRGLRGGGLLQAPLPRHQRLAGGAGLHRPLARLELLRKRGGSGLERHRQPQVALLEGRVGARAGVRVLDGCLRVTLLQVRHRSV
mmetsp:Transcript_74117/g.229106  ORF Transcript_74117/g.229106 Transcript_74117/m.229106 type:complete len:272 (-) Transcript_74117:382-1197(-)